jgi:hypothetical protein
MKLGRKAHPLDEIGRCRLDSAEASDQVGMPTPCTVGFAGAFAILGAANAPGAFP